MLNPLLLKPSKESNISHPSYDAQRLINEHSYEAFVGQEADYGMFRSLSSLRGENNLFGSAADPSRSFEFCKIE